MTYVLNKIVDVVKNGNDIDSTCELVGKEISEKRLTFLQFVESLEEILTSTDKEIRLNGVKAFVAVLKKLPLDFFMSEELDYINQFLCERFIDHHSFVPIVLIGIEYTVQMKNITKQMIVRYFNTIMPHFHCQSQLQNDRYTFYCILQYIFLNRLDDLRFMGPDFLYCVISSMDGERDPNNLILLFRILPQFLRNFPLGHLAEETFDVIACYFPIDFYETEESKITRDELAINLSRCLTCVEEFADFCIPLALEKLEASLKVAKLDSLHLLKLCCETFDPIKIKNHIEEIWRILKMIIMTDTEDSADEIREAAIGVLTALLYSLTIIKGNNEQEQLSNFLDIVLKSSNRFLLDTQATLFIPSIKLLCSVGKTSNYASLKIANKVFLILLNKSDVSQTEIIRIIEAMGLITNMCIQMSIDLSSIPGLETRWEEICCYFLLYSQNELPEIKMSALRALKISTKILTNSQRINYYCILIELIKSDTTDSIRKETLSCFKEAATYFKEEVNREIIQFNLNILNQSNDIVLKSKWLNALCCLGKEEYFFTIISDNLCANLSEKKAETEITLKCLRDLVRNVENINLVHHFALNGGLLNFILITWINGIRSCADFSIFRNEIILEDVSFVINSIVKTINNNEQLQILNQFSQYFNDIMNTKINFKTLSDTQQGIHSYMVIILESVLNSLNTNIKLNNIILLIENCIELSTYSNNPICSLSASRLTATLINKYIDGDENDFLIDKFKLNLESYLNLSTNNNVIIQISWITKSLSLKGHRKMLQWIDWSLNLLADPLYGKMMTQCFKMLTQTDDGYLNKECFCSVKLLYRQRIFCYVIEPLISKYNTSSESVKENYLISILYQMDGNTYVTLSPYFSKILPLLLQLLSPEQVYVLQSLQTFRNLLESKTPVLEDYLQSFVPKLLNLSQSSKYMNIRIVALQCLYNCCDYSLIKLLPLKRQVISELTKCLDDKKRLVRKEVVRTKSRWLSIDVVNDDD
ncbi:hypothetical protein QTP88_014296 [Uroleucon formosanum]